MFLSGCTPAKFNYGEPNAYPFYLIREIAASHETAVLYFNANKKINIQEAEAVLREVGVISVNQVRPNRFVSTLLSLFYLPRAAFLKLFIRLNLPTPPITVPLQLSVINKYPESRFVQHVKQFNPDLVIVFPMQMYFAIKKLNSLRIPVSLLVTDSLALHFGRQLDVIHRIGESRHRINQMMIQAKNLERAYMKIPARYFFVGKMDRESFGINSGQDTNCYFIPHHLYSYSGKEKNWSNSKEAINVVFAGGGHTVYTGDEADIIAAQIAKDERLPRHAVQFFFLGTGYDKAVNALNTAGFTVNHQEWVENYDDFMSGMHVQIFPIIMGTGTKAKVLAAMSSGLLCIGTWYSFENIQANHPEHFLQYDDPHQIPGLLLALINNRETHHQIAISGKLRVLEMHQTSKVVRQILINSEIR